MLVFDIETNGLLPEVSRLWCICTHDTETGESKRYFGHCIPVGLQRIKEAPVICGHNVIDYDIPALKKLYPGWQPTGKVLDSMIWARLTFANVKQGDYGRAAKGILPGQLIGTHKLKAWGYRLGVMKGTYGNDEQVWKEEPTDWEALLSYCEQDVRVTTALVEKLIAKNTPQEAIELEHQVATIISRQCRLGVLFDEKAAQQLYCELIQKKEDLLRELQVVFQPWYARDGKEFVPKKDNKKMGYRADCRVTKIKLVEFNPGSRAHIQYQLKKRYKWEPEEFTKSGEPKLDDEVISALPYPECKPLGEYLTVIKRLGQISDGDEAWLKAVETDGRIRGYVNSNGAGTGRMTHSHPNLAQVPKVGSQYGAECRSLFIAPSGYKLVGCDAAALELRCLSHFMAPYDGGAYGRASIEGRKEDGTDVHTVNQKAIGAESRDLGKTWFYAFIYGAGNPKLGKTLLNGKAGDAGMIGARSRAKFKKNLPALGKLGDKVLEMVKAKGTILGLDKRVVHIRSEHSALNFLLQGAGAIAMKKALVILDEDLQAAGFKNSEQAGQYDYEFVLNVHDEWQIETKAALADTVGKTAVEAIRKAGAYFKFRCPLDGEYAVGQTWKETH